MRRNKCRTPGCDTDRTKGSPGDAWCFCSTCWHALHIPQPPAPETARPYDGIEVVCPHCTGSPVTGPLAARVCCICEGRRRSRALLVYGVMQNVWDREGCTCLACVALRKLRVKRDTPATGKEKEIRVHAAPG